MCGIVGYVGKRSAQDVLLDGLEKLEYRGYDSAGVALALDGGIRVVKSKGRLTALREKLAAQQLAQSFCGIGHTRWATHGEPSDVNSHPHSTPRVSIVHNGIIENYGLLKEINEQPAAIMATVSPRVEDGLPVLRIPELTDEVLRGIGRVHLVGCGTALHAGMVGKSAIETLARVPAEVDIASEFRYRDPILEKNDLVIIISQSGETSDTLAALKLAKSRGVPVLAIVNVVGSSIARAADYVMYTYAGPEIAVASTKAYMVQMCVLYLFALRLAYARGRLNEAETRRYTAQLLRAPEVIKPRLADCEQIKYLASRYVNTQSCFFIGRGFDYALSLEGSLKLKEISYVHSDAYAAGELKHGTISLITDGVPVIALATQKQVYEKTISNAKETRSRGARVLLFTTKDAVVPEGVADAVIRLDEYEDILMPLQLIVPLQLFAYYMAVLRGCDVDKPRNLAKSVTVE